VYETIVLDLSRAIHHTEVMELLATIGLWALWCLIGAALSLFLFSD
jgi:hypothetical protein